VKIAPQYKPEICAHKDGMRPEIAAPYLDVQRRRVVATDGRMLVAVPVEIESGDVSGFIGPSQLDLARGRGPRGTFPDWTACVPTFKEGEPGTVTIGISARLLSDLAKALGSDSRRQVALTIKVDGNDAAYSPMLVRRAENDAGLDEVAVLMPVRIDIRRPDVKPAEAPKA
jgi:hypothetical protein